MVRSILKMKLFFVVLALLLHLVPGTVKPLRSQRSRQDDIAFNSRGATLASASFRFCTMPVSGQPCTPLANIRSDSALNQAFANPSPSGNKGDLRSKNRSVLSASGLNDNGITRAINRDQRFSDPNPYFDIRSFGGYISATNNTMTCSISAGSTTLSCTSNPDFKDASGIPGSSFGHGVVVPGAGSKPSLATPGTPTVTPNLLNGTTTWNYKVIAEDYKGGLTAASSAGTSATGSPALGVVGFTVSSVQRTGGVVTVTTSTAHNLQAGSQVYITGLSADNTANGTVTVNSTPTATTFTFTVGQNPPLFDYGSTPSTGTMRVRACNTLTFPAASFSGQGTLRYWIYRAQGAGTYSLAGVAVGLDPYFVDCGGTAPTPAPGVPATPPPSARAGYLATTITSGGGTTTLTLAASASTTVTNVRVVHDNSSALIAAMNAATGKNGGTVYIPAFSGETPGSLVYWLFNALTDMATVSGSSYVTILIDGHMALGQPWRLRSNLKIEGTTKRNSSFMYAGGALIGSSNGYPLLYAKTASSIVLRNLLLNCSGAQCTDFYSDTNGFAGGSVGIIVENTDFANHSNSSGTARNVVIKGGFDYFFRQWTCDPGLASAVLPAPCMDVTDSSTAVERPSQMAGRMVWSDGYSNGSGIRITDSPNSSSPQAAGYHFRSVLDESSLTPLLRVQTSEYTSDISLTDVISADAIAGAATPIVDGTGSAVLNGVLIQGGFIGTPFTPLYIGPGRAALVGINAGGNPANLNPGNAPSVLLGAPGGQAQTLFMGQPLNISGGRLNYSMAIPGALGSCVVSSGGSVPVGTFSYALTAVDQDSNETVLGPPVNVTTTPGNQTVTCALPALPSGAKGFNGYRNGFRFNSGSCVSPQLTSGSLVDFNSFGCGNSAPLINSAGSSILSNTGLSTYQLRLNGAPLTGTTGSGTLATSSRGSSVPGHLLTFDANGNLVDTGITPTNVTDFFNRASGNLGSEPNSPWTNQAGTLLVTAGGVGGNTGGQNYAIFTGVAFPNDDQSASATWVKSGAPTVQSNVLTLRGSPTALTNYLCGPSNTGTKLTIGKFVSGSFTSLASQNTTIHSGDIVSFNVSGTSLNCYVNGVLVASATDSSISSGFPGLGAFQIYNANGANLQWKNWMASPGYVSLQRPQTWSQMQTFSPGIVIGSDQISAGPRDLFDTFLPGALTSTWTGSTVTLDKAITVTRLQVQAKTAPSGCGTNAIVRLTDGTTPVNVTITAAANDSGAVAQKYSAGATLTLSVQTAAAGCTTAPADAVAVVQFRMQ